MFDDVTEEGAEGREAGWGRRALSLPAVLKDLRLAAAENRRLNERVAELTDVVAELLTPLVEGEPEKARKLLERHRDTTLRS